MIADKIKELRELHQLTQPELAKLLGVTRSSVNAWEMGTNVPTTQYLSDLAKYFRVSTDYLLGLQEKETLVLENLSHEQRKIVRCLVTYFDSINMDVTSGVPPKIGLSSE